MKKTLITLSLACATSLAIAQQKDFEKYLIKYAEWKETATTEWKAQIKKENGGLYYYGAEHLDMPNHRQFAEIKQEWTNFKPTVAFYEGPDRGIADSDSLTIKKFGESGYVRFLAAKAGIKTFTLEPSPVLLYQYLCTRFDQEKVDLYMLTKEAMRLRTRKNYGQAQIEEETVKLLSMFQKMLGAPTKITSIAELEKAFKASFDSALDWWQLPSSQFDPRAKDSSFTNQLAALSSEYRNVYMVEVLAEKVNNGERVFAVVGRNHIPLQINAIRYAVGLPIEKTK